MAPVLLFLRHDAPPGITFWTPRSLIRLSTRRRVKRFERIYALNPNIGKALAKHSGTEQMDRDRLDGDVLHECPYVPTPR
ncbi:hypothetical protein DTL21_13180 [Bremerella cremea]|uniref:Uncharacterized protein n=1 Tax=Blastopirellula marina TaxID=124 RepID=A0A2S8FQK8_9BACT|nr:hypothetical protein C5Y83_13175 [Blastopirellula marina]RCS46961.1 hypothetical protein DTL21_13180 [Bremerella cremea]